MAREPVGGDGGGDLVRVGDRTYSIVRTLAEIDLDNLTREVQDVGGHAIWWGVLYAHAQKEVSRAKLRVEVVEAQTAKALRLERARREEKVTEKIIEEETTIHKDVTAAKEVLLDAEERAGMLRAVTFAIEQKQRTLTAMTGALAREMGANTTSEVDALRGLQHGRMSHRRAVND